MARLSKILILVLAFTLLGATEFKRDDDCLIDLSGGKIRSGETIYWCQDGTTESTLLEIAAPAASVCYDSNTTSDAIGNGEIWIYLCLGNAASVNECTPIYTDQDGDGDFDVAPLNGQWDGTTQRACIWNIPKGRIWIKPATSNGNQTARVQIVGH